MLHGAGGGSDQGTGALASGYAGAQGRLGTGSSRLRPHHPLKGLGKRQRLRGQHLNELG